MYLGSLMHVCWSTNVNVVQDRRFQKLSVQKFTTQCQRISRLMISANHAVNQVCGNSLLQMSDPSSLLFDDPASLAIRDPN